MNRWHLTHGQKGFQVEIVEEPAWAVFADWSYDKLCTLTRHRLSGDFKWDIWWKIPLGWPKYESEMDPDEPPFLLNSLAGGLWSAFNHMTSHAWRHQTRHLRVDISDEDGKRMWGPDHCAWLWEDDDTGNT